MQVFVPVSHCKDTYNFDKTSNYFKKVKEKETKYMVSLCPKLTELLYKLFATRLSVVFTFMPVAVPLNELPTTKLSDILAPLKP